MSVKNTILPDLIKQVQIDGVIIVSEVEHALPGLAGDPAERGAAVGYPARHEAQQVQLRRLRRRDVRERETGTPGIGGLV